MKAFISAQTFRQKPCLSCSIVPCVLTIEKLNLNTASPRLTVTAIVTDQSGPYTVSLSKSESYFSSNYSFPTVSHAVVTISDNVGNSETLKESSPGNYLTTALRGVNGRTYHLKVVSEGSTYEASSYLPYPVVLDSVA